MSNRDNIKVIKYIKGRRKVSKSQLLTDLYRNLDTDALKNIIEVLTEMKVIRTSISSEDNETYYEYRSKD